MGVLIAQLFWPIWLVFHAYGYSCLGMFFGVIVVCFGWGAWWRIEFKSWKIGT